MKKFLLQFLASFLALIVFSGIVVGVGVVLIIGIIAFATGKEKIQTNVLTKNKSVLVIPTSMKITEKNYDDDWATFLNPFSENEVQELGFSRFKSLIEEAKTNDKIAAVLIKSDGIGNSFATFANMRRVLEDFKTTGKKVYAYGTYNENTYLLASVADSIFAKPESYFEWDGIGSNVLFFKKLIDKLGVDVQVFYAGKFKSATEPFRRENMSEENKRQLKAMLSFFYDKFLHTVAKARNIPVARLRSYADQLVIGQPEDAVILRLIDGVKYQDEIYASLKNLLHYEPDEEIHLLPLSKYAASFDEKKAGSSIAVVYLDGEIVGGKRSDKGIVAGERFVKTINKAASDESVHGIVIRVNSPGGDVQASEEIWRAVALAREKKPLVVSFGSVAASGGYYVACGADYIVADPSTVTGSIGVFALIPDFRNFLREKMGLTTDAVKTGKNTVIFGSRIGLHLNGKLNKTQSAFVQNNIDEIYRRFKEKVSKARRLSMLQVERVAQGRVWVADSALAFGLVDTIGYLEDAVKKVARLAGLSAYKIVDYPKMQNRFERIVDQLSENIKTYFGRTVTEELPAEARLYNEYKDLKKAFEKNRILMRLPFNVEF